MTYILRKWQPITIAKAMTEGLYAVLVAMIKQKMIIGFLTANYFICDGTVRGDFFPLLWQINENLLIIKILNEQHEMCVCGDGIENC